MTPRERRDQGTVLALSLEAPRAARAAWITGQSSHAADAAPASDETEVVFMMGGLDRTEARAL